MKDRYDEPAFIDVVPRAQDCTDRQLKKEIRALCHSQPFAVLATQGDGQPYTALISYAVDDDLKHLVFSTPARTRKYDQIVKNSAVSIMVDNRSDQPDSINLISAVTITGRARVLESPEEIAFWSTMLAARHSYLEKFIKAPSSSLILVDATSYYFVRRFQEVYNWKP